MAAAAGETLAPASSLARSSKAPQPTAAAIRSRLLAVTLVFARGSRHLHLYLALLSTAVDRISFSTSFQGSNSNSASGSGVHPAHLPTPLTTPPSTSASSQWVPKSHGTSVFSRSWRRAKRVSAQVGTTADTSSTQVRLSVNRGVLVWSRQWRRLAHVRLEWHNPWTSPCRCNTAHMTISY